MKHSCRKVRKSVRKNPTPSAAILDSQSVRTAEGGEERGYDAGKKDHQTQKTCCGGYAGPAWYMEPIGKIKTEPDSCSTGCVNMVD